MKYSLMVLPLLIHILNASPGLWPTRSSKKRFVFTPEVGSDNVYYTVTSKESTAPYLDAISAALDRNDDLSAYSRCRFTMDDTPVFSCLRYLRHIIAQLKVKCMSQSECEVHAILYEGKALGKQDFTFTKKVTDDDVMYVSNVLIADTLPFQDAIRESLHRNVDIQRRCHYGSLGIHIPAFRCWRYLRNVVSNLKVICSNESHCEAEAAVNEGHIIGQQVFTFRQTITSERVLFVSGSPKADIQPFQEAIGQSSTLHEYLGSCVYKIISVGPVFSCPLGLTPRTRILDFFCSKESDCTLSVRH